MIKALTRKIINHYTSTPLKFYIISPKIKIADQSLGFEYCGYAVGDTLKYDLYHKIECMIEIQMDKIRNMKIMIARKKLTIFNKKNALKKLYFDLQILILIISLYDSHEISIYLTKESLEKEVKYALKHKYIERLIKFVFEHNRSLYILNLLDDNYGLISDLIMIILEYDNDIIFDTSNLFDTYNIDINNDMF